MKTLQFLLLFMLLSILQSCSSQTTETKEKTVNQATQKTSVQYTEGKDYSLFERIRVTDNKGFTTPVEAYSLLLPKGWKHEGNINWVYNGSTANGNGTYNHFKATSPDNKYSFEILPEIVWSWIDDPQLLQFMQNNTNSNYAFVAQPMGAEDYVRNMFITRELNGATVKDVQPNNEVVHEMQKNFQKIQSELMSYGASSVQFHPSAVNATVSWGNDKEGMVMCGVTITETTLINQYNGSMNKSYTTDASKRIIFQYPSTDKQAAQNMLTVIIGSIRTNTAWKTNVDNFWKQARQRSDVANREKIKMMDEQTNAIARKAISNGNQRLQQMDMDLRRWEEGQASQDRMNTNFIKAIREVETYQDATGKVELSSGYDHAWSRGDGSNFILSNNPNFDPSSVFQDQQWSEMKLMK